MSGAFVATFRPEVGYALDPVASVATMRVEIGYQPVDPGDIEVHATQLSTGSSWNTGLDATRLHMERDEFLAEHDTPEVYTGSAGKFVIVNDYEDALDFGAEAETFLELTDTPGSYGGQATKYVRVNTGSSALEFYDAPGGGAGEGIVGVLVHDEGVFLGTGTVINMVGDYLSMSLSGSVAKIEQGAMVAEVGQEFWVKTTGSTTYSANNTWERLNYLTGTISVDRDCLLVCQVGLHWGTVTANWERMQLQYELDGVQTGRIWQQYKDANVILSMTFWADFMETFEVSSGTHGIAIYTHDGGASGDRAIDRGLLLIEAPLGATWQV